MDINKIIILLAVKDWSDNYRNRKCLSLPTREELGELYDKNSLDELIVSHNSDSINDCYLIDTGNGIDLTFDGDELAKLIKGISKAYKFFKD